MWLLYQILAAVALALSAPWLLLRRGGHYLATVPGRLARRLPATPARRPLWLHAVSVGEVGVAATLAGALPAGERLLVTTVTPTGQQRARALFSAAPFAGRAVVAFLPFELGFAVRRFFDRLRPRALVLVEGDYWPLVLRAARRRRLPMAVVNGRVGDASYRRMRRLAPLVGPLLAPVDRFGVQGERDRRRLLDLGVPAERVTVTGNLKFDTPEPAVAPQLAAALDRLAGGRPILLAGSTMAGRPATAPPGAPEHEEAAVVDAFRGAGGGERALLLVAPRHPERWPAVERFLRGSGLAVVRRGALAEGGAARAQGRPDVVLLDSLGELAGLYRLAAACFVGGTLAPTGGHNPLEAARFGVPVAAGPSMENFRDVAAELDTAGAWARVADATGLAAVWRRWLDDPAAARAVGGAARELFEANRGALGRTLAMLAPLLDEAGGDGAWDGP